MKSGLLWPAVLTLAWMTQSACPGWAWAQSAPLGMSVTGYPGATAMVQEPPGSPWQAVPTASLPPTAPVVQYMPDQWVQIMAQGKPVRISIMNVQVAGEPSPVDVKPCPNGQYAAESGGSSGLGGC